MSARYLGSVVGLALSCLGTTSALGEDPVQLDPFAQATRGYPACPEVGPPLLRADQARNESHVRVERGLRCAMDGTCEPGGAYKRDTEINERMRGLIAADPRFANTSLWLTTSRKWVTLQGCVHSAAQRKSLVAFIANQRDVEKVFDELTVGIKPTHAAH